MHNIKLQVNIEEEIARHDLGIYTYQGFVQVGEGKWVWHWDFTPLYYFVLA